MKKFLALLLAMMMAVCAIAVAEEDEETYDAADKGSVVVEDYAVTENLPDEWWNILLLGTDDYDNLDDTYTRTDSMIILSVNMGTKEAKLTSVMRDTWVSIHGRSSKAKLNAASVYGGPELTMRTINECFGMNITDYMLVNLPTLAEVIDTLGGVDLEVTEAERRAVNGGLHNFSSQSGMERLESSGNVHLNGNQAVAFSRIRKIDSDYRRTERQRMVLMALATKLKEESDMETIATVIGSLLSEVDTNLELSDLMNLAMVGLQMDLNNMEQFRIPADGTYRDGMFGSVWCIKPDFEANTKLLHEFIYGE